MRIGQTSSAVLFGILIAGCSTSRPQESVRPYTEFRELTSAEKAIITNFVSSTLKDPGSAQFKWAPFPKSHEGADTPVYYCGLVNAKNSFGGYVGFKPFIVNVYFLNGKVAGAGFVEIANDEITPSEQIQQRCAQKGLFTDGAI